MGTRLGASSYHLGMKSEEAVQVSLTFEEVASFKREVLRERPYSGRVSFALAVRLAEMQVGRGDYFSVLDQLDFLEGLRKTSAAVAGTQFRRRPLHPFWHIHAWAARHLARNLIVRWGLDGDGNRDFDRLLEEVEAECGDEPEKWPALIADRVVIGGLETRARTGAAATVREHASGGTRGYGLTGDWIIYGKHEGENYYMDLATHDEGKTGAAEQLYQKLRNGCAAEFPFLFATAPREEQA